MLGMLSFPLLLSSWLPFGYASSACPSASSHPWCDASKELDERVDLLMAALHDDELPVLLSNNLFGGVPAIDRIGLPKYTWINEADHGLLKVNVTPMPTSFPQVGLLAASFNKSLFHAIGAVTAQEAVALKDLGLQDGLLLHNNINIFRDPRWGRGQETPGEDPFLTATYAEEWVRGVQGTGSDGRMLAAAACKHFAAYSFEGVVPHSRHSFDARLTAQDLADTYLPAFEACVKAGAKGLMCSYNALNGTPACANKELLSGIARERWNFDGVIVTDCDAVGDLAPDAMFDGHNFVKNRAEATLAAIEAGVDVDCGGTFRESALVSKALLQRSVRRTLKMRFELGEFDPKRESSKTSDGHDNKKLALDAVLQGAVLLKNDKNVLPLKRNIRLSVFGNLANSSDGLLGDYSSAPVDVVTILEGLKYNVEDIHFENGTADICSSGIEQVNRPNADAIIIVVGLKGEDRSLPNVDLRGNTSECLANCLEAEGCDRQILSLPVGQQQLIQQASTWDIPVVLVIASGGPVDMSPFAEHLGIHGILWTGYPGEQAGKGVASLIFGAASPSGRLPLTFYKGSYASAVPIESMSMRPTSGRPGRSYRFVDSKFVVYPFGHGLTYDTWEMSWIPTNQREMKDSFACSVQLNVSVGSLHGKYEPTFVVLLFLRPPSSASESAPLRELHGFKRIRLERGQYGQQITFKLSLKDFQLADSDGKWQLQSGRWTIEIGEPATLHQQVDVSPYGCNPVSSHASSVGESVVV